jgi:hypothetical protein
VRRALAVIGLSTLAFGLAWDRSCNTDPASVDACAGAAPAVGQPPTRTIWASPVNLAAQPGG